MFDTGAFRRSNVSANSAEVRCGNSMLCAERCGKGGVACKTRQAGHLCQGERRILHQADRQLYAQTRYIAPHGIAGCLPEHASQVKRARLRCVRDLFETQVLRRGVRMDELQRTAYATIANFLFLARVLKQASIVDQQRRSALVA